MAGGLGAVAAIFGTSPRLDGEEGALLDLGGVPIHAVNSGCLVHEFMEWLVVDLCDFLFGPVMTDSGGDVGHGTGFFVCKEGVTLAIIVW